MDLYHFTSTAAWESIRAAGEISPKADRGAGLFCRPAVFLTTVPDVTSVSAGEHDVCMHVRLDEATITEHNAWIRTACPPEVHYSFTSPSAGGRPDEWYVTEAPISPDRWISVKGVETGETLWLNR